MSDLWKLNDHIFAELDRLAELDVNDAEAREAEIERSKAIGSMAGRAIENARAVMDAVKVQIAADDTIADSMAIPRLLLGEPDIEIRVDGR